jgi:hypothetical protein
MNPQSRWLTQRNRKEYSLDPGIMKQQVLHCGLVDSLSESLTHNDKKGDCMTSTQSV